MPGEFQTKLVLSLDLVLSCDVSAIDETTKELGFSLPSRNVFDWGSCFLLIHTIAIPATDYVIVMNWIPLKSSTKTVNA